MAQHDSTLVNRLYNNIYMCVFLQALAKEERARRRQLAKEEREKVVMVTRSKRDIDSESVEGMTYVYFLRQSACFVLRTESKRISVKLGTLYTP